MKTLNGLEEINKIIDNRINYWSDKSNHFGSEDRRDGLVSAAEIFSKWFSKFESDNVSILTDLKDEISSRQGEALRQSVMGDTLDPKTSMLLNKDYMTGVYFVLEVLEEMMRKKDQENESS